MNAQGHFVEVKAVPDRPRRFVFALLNNFTMLSFASAVESLRIANRMAGRGFMIGFYWARAGIVWCVQQVPNSR